MNEPTPTDRSDSRRELILLSALNGIDSLEVLDSNAPALTPHQRTLVVELFQPVPAGFGAGNLRLEGGVRVKDIGIAWAFGAAQFDAASVPADVVPAAEQASLKGYLQGRYPAAAERAKILVVRTGTGTHDWEGDLSTYTLRLATGPDDDSVPPGFDLKFSEVELRFKVECPRDYDCDATVPCPPEVTPAPRIDYLAKDYQSFRRLMLDRLAVVMPGWTERNAADVGVMLVEALAYTADHLSYYQDAVATEAYLGTARRRVSVRRHARLLNYRMHDGCNARAWVSIESGLPDGRQLAAGTVLCTRQKAPAAVANEKKLDDGTQFFAMLQPIVLHEAQSRITIYGWGGSTWFLPKGGTHATLDATQGPLSLSAGDVLIFEEVLGPDGKAASADARRRQAVRLTAVADPQHDELTGVDFVEVDWGPDDALQFPLCVRTLIDGVQVDGFTVARGNVVLTDAGIWLRDPPLPPPEGGMPYRPSLIQPGIVSSVPSSSTAAAGQALFQDPKEALPQVAISGAGGPWTAMRDLLESGDLDPVFVVEVERDGIASLRFGDGVQGKALPPLPPLPPLAPLIPQYRIGNGAVGNVGAEAIGHVVDDGVTDFSSVKSIRNPLPAAGGVEPESMTEVKLYAPQAFQTQQRAVTEADYEAAAEKFAGVRQAVARRRWTGSWYTVFLSIDRDGALPVDASFAGQVRDSLERYRLAGEDLEVEGPSYVALDIVMGVCVAAGYFQSDVHDALVEAFSVSNFFDPDNFGFAQPVYLSQVVAKAMAIPGVVWVDLSDAAAGQRFQRFGKPAAGEEKQGYIPMGRLEIARADSDPNFPENGRVDFILEGGL
jgi:hypothetical protein